MIARCYDNLFLLFCCLFAQQHDQQVQQGKGWMKRIRNQRTARIVPAGKNAGNLKKPPIWEAWYYMVVHWQYNHKDGEHCKLAGSFTENASLLLKLLQVSTINIRGTSCCSIPTKLLLPGCTSHYYAYNNRPDSAECAYASRQRGGINKTVATYFSRTGWMPHAYLFTTGICTLYLMYLQWVEHYRSDVLYDLTCLTQLVPDWIQERNSTPINFTNDDLGKVTR